MIGMVRCCCLTILVVASVAACAAAEPVPAPSAAPSQTPSAAQPQTQAPTYYDYAPLLQYAQSAQGIALRHPTPEEIERLGPLWPKAPWHRNAASYYFKALTLAKAAAARSANLEPPGTSDGEAPYAGDKKALEGWVDHFRPALKAMCKGLRFDYCQPPVFLTTEMLPTQPPRPRAKLPWSVWPMDMRSFAAYCADAAFVEELDGRSTRAARWHLRCLRMMTQARRAGDELRSLEAINGASVALCELHRLMANQALPEEMLHEIAGQCLASESLPDELSMMWEREKVRLDDMYAAFDFGQGPEAEGAWEKARSQLAQQYPGSAPPRDYQQLRNDLEDFESKVAEVLRRPLSDLASDKPGGATLVRLCFPQTGPPSFFARVYCAVILTAPESYATGDVRLRETEAQAAVILYQKKFGRLPVKLEDLVPDYLPVVPEDPFSKAPIRFALTDYGWKVWSVGPNHTDEGGVGLDPLTSTRPDLVLRSNTETNEQRRSGFRLAEENGQLVLKKRIRQ